MPLSSDELLAFLASLGIASETRDHEAVFTVSQSQAGRGEIPGGHTKNLFVKDKKGRIFLLVAHEHATIDLKQVHHAIGAQGRVSFGSPELLFELLGVQPGSVTAFGVVNDASRRVTVVIEAALMRETIVNCHPRVNTRTTSLSAEGLVAFLKATGHEPLIVAFAEAPHARP